MGNKIITEKDFWKCSGGLLPTQFQSGQSIAKKKSGEKYITKADTATVGFADFSCKKLMLIMAILAAVIAIAVVATGGAALIAIGAIAGAAGALFGAVLGSLLCGQMVAKVRKWVTAKENFKIMGIPTITGDHVMECPLFGDKITFAPEIKSWGQALAQGGANLIGGVMEGMMAGAAVGVGGALFGAGRVALSSGGLRGLGQAGFNFLKSAPSNIMGNFGQGLFSGAGFKLIDGMTNWLGTYGETAEASTEDFLTGVKDSSFGDVAAIKNILTTGGKAQDYVAVAMLLTPGAKPKSHHNSHLNSHEVAHSQQNAERRNKKADAEESSTRLKSHTSDIPTAKKGDHAAYAEGGDASIKPKAKKLDPIKLDNPIVLSNKLKNKQVEFDRQLKAQQDIINNMKVKDWLQNRENFKNRNKADYNKKANEARNNYRQKELAKRSKEYMKNNPNVTYNEAQKVAQESMKGQAALHNPDGVAGGKIDQITGMGDSRVNSSIGSQWGHGRAQSIENQVKAGYGIPPKTINDIPNGAMMNVDLF